MYLAEMLYFVGQNGGDFNYFSDLFFFQRQPCWHLKKTATFEM